MDEMLLYPPSRSVEQIHPIVLAYMGDCLYDLFIRQFVIAKSNHKPEHLHKLATQYVSAKAQSLALRNIMDRLSEEELEVVRKGRNAKSGSIPKNTDISDYRQSTAFESLLGFLFYKEQYERLTQIMQMTVEEGES